MRLFLLLPLVFLLSCTPKDTPPAPDLPSSSSSLPTVESSSSSSVSSASSSSVSAESDAHMAQNQEVYSEEYLAANGEAAFLKDVIGNGKWSLLFFGGVSCVACQETANTLKALYAAETFPYSTYALDFEQAATLKERYGVTAAHTFVLLDSDGEALQTVVNPSEMDLKYLLATR